MRIAHRGATPILIGLTVLAAAASGANFPAGNIRIVTSQVGGLNDFTARVLAPELAGALGKQVIVDNRGGIAIDIVAKASPDGHTILCFANNFWLLPFLQKKVSFNPMAVTSRAPSALAPGIPTLWESGLPGYEATAMIAFLAPAGTAASIVTRLNQ